MRPLLALILLLSVSSAHAELRTESLPAGAAGVVGMDLTAFRASKVGQAFEKFTSMKTKQLEASRKLSEQLGIDSMKDLHEIVIAVYPGDDGKVSEKDASGIVLIRGKFLPARINAFGQANALPSKPAATCGLEQEVPPGGRSMRSCAHCSLLRYCAPGMSGRGLQ